MQSLLSSTKGQWVVGECTNKLPALLVAVQIQVNDPDVPAVSLGTCNHACMLAFATPPYRIRLFFECHIQHDCQPYEVVAGP